MLVTSEATKKEVGLLVCDSSGGALLQRCPSVRLGYVKAVGSKLVELAIFAVDRMRWRKSASESTDSMSPPTERWPTPPQSHSPTAPQPHVLQLPTPTTPKAQHNSQTAPHAHRPPIPGPHKGPQPLSATAFCNRANTKRIRHFGVWSSGQYLRSCASGDSPLPS